MPVYKVSSELEKLGKELIAKHHPALGILEIAFIFRDEAPNSSRGDLLFGQAISIDSRNWILHRKDVMVCIMEDLWVSMDPEYQRLLLDHELCHIGIELDEHGTVVMDEDTGRPKVYMVRHEIEEFYVIMKRYAAIYDTFRAWAKKEGQRRMSARKKSTMAILNPTT